MKKILNMILMIILPPEIYAKYLGVKIGNNCEFYKNIKWGSEPYLIKIGNNVRITSGVKFITHDGGVWVLRNIKNDKSIDVFGKITIGDNCHIGWDAIIMPGVSIGNNCVIGAGAIVTKNIPDNSVAVGVPAKVIESIDEYDNKVNKKCICTKNMSSKEKKKELMKKIGR